MTEATLKLQKAENQKQYIASLLTQLTNEYQNTKPERQALTLSDSQEEDQFTLNEEIELLTSDIRGFACKIQTQGLTDTDYSLNAHLLNKGVFDIPAIARFYHEVGAEYPHLKGYLQKLDYLRLLVLEYLNSSALSTSETPSNQ